jgi:hypothetical protein
VLSDVPTGAQAQDQAASGELVDGGGHSGDHCRVAESHREDERPEADPAAVLGRVQQAGEGLERVSRLGTAEGEEMVGSPEGLESQLFRPLDNVAPLLPSDAFLRLDHHPELHLILRASCRLLERSADDEVAG